MQPRALGCLLDFKGACEEIRALVGPNPAERLLLVVGEALVRLRSVEATVLESIPDWEAVIGMRNAIVLGYDTIDASPVRDSVRDDLPLLLSALV